MSLILRAVPFKQRSTSMYLAVVRLSDLEYFSIDILDPPNIAGRNGYQRELDESRIKKIAKFFESHSAIMPLPGRSTDQSMPGISKIVEFLKRADGRYRFGLAIAVSAALVYLPFSQRSLLLMAAPGRPQ